MWTTARKPTITVQNLLQYHFDDIIRAFFIVGDVRLSLSDHPDEENFVCSGEIPVFDMSGFSWRHATKAVISTLRVYMKYTQVGQEGPLQNPLIL